MADPAAGRGVCRCKGTGTVSTVTSLPGVVLVTDQPCSGPVHHAGAEPPAVGDYVIDLISDRGAEVAGLSGTNILELRDDDGAHWHCPAAAVYIVERAEQ